MGRRLLGVALASVLIVALLPGAAQAKKPLDVDCDALAYAITAVDFVQEQQGTDFKSLGALLSAVKKDTKAGGTLFAELSGGIAAFSAFYDAVVNGNVPPTAIEFTHIGQVVPTTAKCGLTTHLIGEIEDSGSYQPVPWPPPPSP